MGDDSRVMSPVPIPNSAQAESKGGSPFAQPPEVVVVAIGSAGDVLPLAALAAELARRGRRVLLLAAPSQAALARRIGVAFHPLLEADEEHAAVSNPRLWHPLQGFEVLWPFVLKAARNTLAALTPFAGRAAPLLVGSTMALGARLAHELWGWPHATAQVSPCWTFSAHRPPRLPGLGWLAWLPQAARAPTWAWLDRRLLDGVAAPGLNLWRAELGLAPVERVVGRWSLSPQQILGLYPDWFAQRQPDWPRRLTQTGFTLFDGGTGGALAPELDAFLGPDRQVLVFGAGSSMHHADAFFAAAAQASASLGRRALFLGPGSQQAWPAHVLALPFAPLSQVLPRAAALVSHPGIGTMAQALTAGVPQLLTPYAFDHFDNAALGQALGVARLLRRPGSAGHMTRALRALLSDSAVLEACRAAAGQPPGGPTAVVQACDRLEARLAGPVAGVSGATPGA
jgi:rhamnosyltransferase subunit B